MKTNNRSLQAASSDDKHDGVNITSRLLNLIFDLTLSEKLRLLKELDSWNVERSRRHARKPWTTAVQYSAGEGTFRDLMKDISAGGVFIETRTPFTVGQPIIMKFRLPRSRKLIQATGEIVRTTDRGIGVAFWRQSEKETDRTGLPDRKCVVPFPSENRRSARN